MDECKDHTGKYKRDGYTCPYCQMELLRAKIRELEGRLKNEGERVALRDKPLHPLTCCDDCTTTRTALQTFAFVLQPPLNLADLGLRVKDDGLVRCQDQKAALEAERAKSAELEKDLTHLRKQWTLAIRADVREAFDRAERAESALQRVRDGGLVRCFNTHIANACGHDALRKCRACLWNEENP